MPDWTCPVTRTARVLGDECSLLILRDLRSGPHRFGQLLGSAAGNTRLLSSRLRRLTAAGILDRSPVAGHPPGVEYRLSPMGVDLLPALDLLREFGERWLPALCDPLQPPEAAPWQPPSAPSSAPRREGAPPPA